MGYRLVLVLGCLGLLACGRSSQKNVGSSPASGGEAGEAGEAEQGGASSSAPTAGTASFTPNGGTGTGGGGGAGVPGTCTVSAQFCIQGDIYVCTAQGTLELSQTCATDRCESTEPGAAMCAAQPCQPGLGTCSNNVLFLCTADAKLPEVGTDCGDDVCDQGACRPKICTPGTKQCIDGNVHACSALATSMQQLEPCSEGTRCFEVEDDAYCQEQLCTPGEVVCLDEQLGTCSADGFELAHVTEDCAGQGELCDLAGEQCNPTIIDTLSGIAFDGSYEPAMTFGTFVAVDVPRTLTALAFNLDVLEESDVVWLIYVFEPDGYALKLEQPATLQPGSGYMGTTPLDFQLEGGRNYFFAFYTGNLVGSGYYVPSPTTRDWSLGYVVGGTGVGGVDYHDKYSYEATTAPFDIRLTTAPAKP